MRIVCVDDERLSLQFIEKQLEQIEGISIVAMFTNPLEAKEYILNEAIDTAFLDVQMPGINGIQLAEQILEYKPDINIVFITAYDQYAVEAFQLNALDYVIKPTTVERLHKTLKRVKAKLKNTANDKDSNQEDHSLRIKVSNYLAFEEKPNVFQPVSWRTSKSQELFIYLLHNRNRLVEKSAIVDLLWYDHDVEKAYALLYTTVYNTRKQLKKYRPNIK
ncbi:MAG TPA: response regulator, partial [Pseudogracilibacillus sp.]|nr:response regulator [Pseudogracilibacillus sp.]